MPDPAIVYKYTKSVWALQTLRSLEIKVTPPAELNDPFEFTAPLVGQPSRRHYKKAIFDKGFIRENLRAANPSLSRAELKQLAHRLKDYTKKDPSALSMENFTQGMRDRMEELNASSIAVLSTSARENGILLWAHYGDFHKGMAIGLDRSLWGSGNRGFFKVNYSDARPTIDLAKTLPRCTESTYEMYRKIVQTKSPEWAYEEEYRALFDPNDPKTVRLQQTSEGDLMLASLPPEAIRTVIIGSRCSEENERRLREIVAEEPLKHIRILRAILARERFAIEICEA